MKTTKLILALVLCFALFNGCSNDESIIEESIEEQNLNDYSALKSAGEAPPDYTQLTYLLIEYKATATQVERAAVISQYSAYVGLLSIMQCPNDSRTEIWTVDASIYDCPGCGKPKAAAVGSDEDVERAIESNNCND